MDASLTRNPIGRRMTIMQLPHGGLALHSPIYLEGQVKSSFEKLGNVEYILVPNEWHTLDTKKVHDQYPQAKILVPLELQNKLSEEFPVGGTYEKDWTKPILDEIDTHSIGGLKKPEVALFHKASKTLIVADLFFNFSQSDFSGVTKFLMGLNQATVFGVTRFYKWSMVKNKAAFKVSMQEMLEQWDIDKIIMGHGHIVKKNGADLIWAALETI